jgi:RNA polymerase-binding transcription factor DksA
MSAPEEGLPEMEKHADIGDIATDLEMSFTAAAIRAVQQRMKRSQEPDADGVYAILDCLECGAEIGRGRLHVAMKNTICVFCATAAESYLKGHP